MLGGLGALALVTALAVGCAPPTYVDMSLGTEAGSGFEAPVREVRAEDDAAVEMDAGVDAGDLAGGAP
jgi:hypothetical protein